MKQRFIFMASLALLFSPLLRAADTVDAYQRNNSNQLTLTQSGVLTSTAAIDQNGFGIATINQVGIGGSITNDVQVVQDGNGVITGNENRATVNQNAGGNVAYILQTDLATIAVVGAGNNSGGAGASYKNTATITQDGINNTLAQIDQVGNTNVATVSQDGANSGTISQSGSSNTATVEQRVTSGFAANVATNDTAAVFQQGANGTVSVTQSGAAASHSATVSQMPGSSDTTAIVIQSGGYNIASVTQSNTFNVANVTQDGTGSGTTYATGGNEIIITQDGSGVSGSADTATAVQHGGNSNQITITQHRGDGSVVNITQNGFSNTATITQN